MKVGTRELDPSRPERVVTPGDTSARPAAPSRRALPRPDTKRPASAYPYRRRADHPKVPLTGATDATPSTAATEDHDRTLDAISQPAAG